MPRRRDPMSWKGPQTGRWYYNTNRHTASDALQSGSSIGTIVQIEWSCQQYAPNGFLAAALNPLILKGSGYTVCQCRLAGARHILAIVTVALAGCGLSGCGSINENIAAGVSDAIPRSDRRSTRGRAATARYREIWRVHAGARAKAADAGIRTGEGSEARARHAGCGALAPCCVQSTNTTVVRPLTITRSSRW